LEADSMPQEHGRIAKRPILKDAPVDFQPSLPLNLAFHMPTVTQQQSSMVGLISEPESSGQPFLDPDLRFARHLSAPELPQLGNILGVLGDRAQGQPKLMLQRQSALLGDGGIAPGTAESSQDIIARLQGQIAAITEASDAQRRVVEALKVRTDQAAVSNTMLVVESPYSNNAAGSASGQQVQVHRTKNMVASTTPVATASQEALPRRRKHTHLDSSAVIRIFLAKRSGYTGFVSRTLSTTLSKEYGLTPKAVRDIWSMKTWRKVTQPYWNAEDRQRAWN